MQSDHFKNFKRFIDLYPSLKMINIYFVSGQLRFSLVRLKRPFPSCYEPHYESEAKCKALHMKISFVCI